MLQNPVLLYSFLLHGGQQYLWTKNYFRATVSFVMSTHSVHTDCHITSCEKLTENTEWVATMSLINIVFDMRMLWLFEKKVVMLKTQILTIWLSLQIFVDFVKYNRNHNTVHPYSCICSSSYLISPNETSKIHFFLLNSFQNSRIP